MPTDVREWLRRVFQTPRPHAHEPVPEQAEDDTERGQLLAGHWLPIRIHDQPASMAYQEEANRLFIQYPDKTAYAYDNVTADEAQSLLAHGDHGGGWVWKNLRVLGTLWGYRKPFQIVADPGAVRMWSKTKRGQQKHALIPESGSPFPGFQPGRRL